MAHRLCARRARKLRKHLLARDGNQCWLCERPFDPAFDGTGHDFAPSIVHLVCDTHAFEHLRLAHRVCTARARASLPQ